jgi:hypothetical protein
MLSSKNVVKVLSVILQQLAWPLNAEFLSTSLNQRNIQVTFDCFAQLSEV